MHKLTCKTQEKSSQGETQLDQSHATTFALMNVPLLDLTTNSQLSFYHESFRK